MRSVVVIFIAFLACLGDGLARASADYLEVRRSATIKDQPDRNGAIHIRPQVGSHLLLLDDGQQVNGYYRAADPETGVSGWIYRTLVRRFDGEIDGGAFEGESLALPLEDLMITSMIAHFIDVGQGDATLLEFPCGVVLVDAGGEDDENSDALIDYITSVLARRGDDSETIDTLFVTHTHIDHNRTLRRVFEEFNVERYVHNGIFDGSGRWPARHIRDTYMEPDLVEALAVRQQDVAGIGTRSGFTNGTVDPLDCEAVNPELKVLSGPYLNENPGWPSGVYENGNNRGITLRVDYGQSSILFTGDLEEQAIDTLVQYYRGTEMLDVDVYQVGHHGSWNGSTDHLLQAMLPDIAVLSNGGINDTSCRFCAWAYGHPRESTVSLLERWIDRRRSGLETVETATGARSFQSRTLSDAIYSTAWDGNIVVVMDHSGVMSVLTDQRQSTTGSRRN